MALPVACAYLIPRVFIETRDYKFSSTISDMNVFCLLMPLPFPASKKIVFLEYIVASGNADCALLFDGFSSVIQWLSISKSLASLSHF